MRISSIFSSILLALLVVVPFSFVQASDFKAGQSITIPKDELISDNVYLAGADVAVSSAPLKDLVAAGGQLTINAPVWGDALLAGGNINVLELVHGDLRAAGGQVKVAQAVGGDAVLAGGQVQILPGSVVSGDVVIAGGDIVLDGIVHGTTRIYGGVVEINGTVSGPLYIKAGQSVSFGEKAIIKSQIIYTAPEEAVIAEGAKVPEDVRFTQLPTSENNKEVKENLLKGVFAAIGIFFFLKFITVLLTTLIVASVFKKFSLAVATDTLNHFWYRVLIGFVTLIAVPVAIITLLITIVGSYLGLILMVLYGIALLGAGVFLNITAGALLAKWIKKEMRIGWKWVLLGTFSVSLVALIPIVGWVAVGLLYLASLGAAVVSIFRDAKAKM